MMPTQPINHLPSPFAVSGEYKVIPDDGAGTGRASFKAGFPQETQLPMSMGGVAPNRMDINGILYLVTALGFWQQSGGQWRYSTALSYTTPCIVYHDKRLWWCLKENGIESANGRKEPGKDASYWMDLGEFLVDLSYLEKDLENMGGKIDDVESKIGTAVPVGTVIMYYADKAPAGYLACDGSRFAQQQYPELYKLLGNSNTLPDLRGYFVRGRDSLGSVDPDGKNRKIGSFQGDAIRNITGSFSTRPASGHNVETGVFKIEARGKAAERRSGTSPCTYSFDASRVVPTAGENRPKNVCLLYCIKHD